MDEQSIANLGRWPWSRDVHARMTDLLAGAGLDEPVERRARRAHFVPETMTLADFMNFSQRSHAHIAVVADEYGGTEGLVTLQDVLEALAGLREFWPDPEAGDLQPADRTTRRRDPVPKTRWPEVGARLAEIKAEGGDPAVCLAIGRRFVAEYRVEANRVWMKAAQFFFGKSADAPWRALYRAHVTNEALDLEAVEA